MWSLAAAAAGARARGARRARRTRASASFVKTREPWQRADATLANLDDAARPRDATTAPRSSAARAPSSCVQIAGGGADELLRTLRGLGNVERPQPAGRRSRGRRLARRSARRRPCASARWCSSSRGLALGTRWRSGSASSLRSPGRSRTTSTSTSRASRRSCARSATPSRSSRRRTAPRSSQPAASRSHNGSFDDERARRPRAGRADLAAQPRRRAGRRADEPLARAPHSAASTSCTASSPALPSLSYLALRDAESLAVATFFSPERLGVSARARAARAAARADRRAARRRREETAAAAAVRFPGDVPASSPKASTRRCSSRRTKERLIVLEWRPTERPLHARRAAHARRASGLAARHCSARSR